MTSGEKEKALEAFFDKSGKTIVAFSGGADSSLLAAAAAAATGAVTADTPTADTLIADAPAPGIAPLILAVTVKTELVSDKELKNACETANEIGIPHIFIDKKILGIPEIENNRKDRCYVCKKEILNTILEYAAENGFDTVVEGTNYSDKLMNDTDEVPRPGFSFISERKEFQEKQNEKSGAVFPKLYTPLADLEITKEEVREIAKRRNLSVAGKPSMSCLATRFSYDSKLAPELLKTIDEAEKILEKTGAKQIRIRVHTDTAGRKIARIEVNKNETEIFFDEKNQKIIEELILFLKQNGFSYVTADLEGFRSGSMDI